jgi:hypothetical protein
MAFLRRVTEDDRFRATLEADPQAALAQFGLSVEADQIPSEVTIPNLESISDVLMSSQDQEDETDQSGLMPWMGLIAS